MKSRSMHRNTKRKSQMIIISIHHFKGNEGFCSFGWLNGNLIGAILQHLYLYLSRGLSASHRAWHNAEKDSAWMRRFRHPARQKTLTDYTNLAPEATLQRLFWCNYYSIFFVNYNTKNRRRHRISSVARFLFLIVISPDMAIHIKRFCGWFVTGFSKIIKSLHFL